MNPEYEYALPIEVARLMLSPATVLEDKGRDVEPDLEEACCDTARLQQRGGDGAEINSLASHDACTNVPAQQLSSTIHDPHTLGLEFRVPDTDECSTAFEGPTPMPSWSWRGKRGAWTGGAGETASTSSANGHSGRRSTRCDVLWPRRAGHRQQASSAPGDAAAIVPEAHLPARLQLQLDGFEEDDLFLGWLLLSGRDRRSGGERPALD